MLPRLVGEERKALENRLSVELEMVDDPAGKVVCRGSPQELRVGVQHLGYAAALRRRPNRHPEIDRYHCFCSQTSLAA